MQKADGRRKRKKRLRLYILGHRIDPRKLGLAAGLLLILILVLALALFPKKKAEGGTAGQTTANQAGQQPSLAAGQTAETTEALPEDQAESTRPENQPAAVILADPGEEGILTDNASLLGDTGGIGYHANVDRTDSSNVVIIGDSRIVAMSTYCGQVSYNATVGAHYLYQQAWAERDIPMIIPWGMEERGETAPYGAGYYQEMSALVRKCMEKHGSCRIVIASSVNDADYYNWSESEASRMMELGKALKEDGTAGGNSPSLYYVAMVPLEGKFEVEKQGFTPKGFNDYLAEQVSASGEGTYIGIGDISDWEGLYLGDGIHFQPEGTRQFFDRILAGLNA